MVTRRLFELYIRILIHCRHWAVITGCPSSTFITCFTEQPDSFGECYYFFLSFIIPALNSLMDQKAHDLGESVIHIFKANLHILLALWLWVKCAVSLCKCRVPGLANKNTWCLFFFFFWFWLAAQRSIWDLSSQNVSMKVARSCPTLCNPLGILQARILEWVAVPFSRGSSQPRSRTQVSCIARGFFTSWATRVIPRLGIKSVAPVLKAWSLSHWTTGKSQHNAWIQISDNPLSFNINISHESNPQYDEYRQ